MAINQSQVDHIISAASADDPEVKLQNLQDEVDLLKKSVKKLLIDLRERLNETENPFIVSAMLHNSADAAPQLPTVKPGDANAAQKSDNAAAEPAKQEDTNTNTQSAPASTEVAVPGQSDSLQNPDGLTQGGMVPVGDNGTGLAISGVVGGNLPADPNQAMNLAMLKKQIADIEKNAMGVPDYTEPQDRPKLQRLHSLFEWVSRMVNKYGHDRLLIMIDTYCYMRYVTEDVSKQVKELSKLMPDSIGAVHEISSEEFVAELYVLNRIISPEDSSLDREMIEVLIDKKDQKEPGMLIPDITDQQSEEDWIKMLERV
ncbi:MAG: hypothetical protein II893_07725 [Methanomicrobium sp.]|nr:hypothetical protein [Methanomicrobium sp.]